ncbi:DUF349 domain-containing protein [Nesterenkonia sp. NBAIMH1]|uniref:DUF349 domain-containing protein n=1 Tax=Nesterenkonia sp. NBAIMH1 TaxID=2600320 RepID=UPI0011B3C1B0|nr:DUF349 domain-containing protein [Nesterenkonia sp. NBAIMH1]
MSRAAVKPTYHQTSLDEARERARVDEEGHVYLKPPEEGSEEIYVGQYSAAGEEQALAYFTRKFDELYNRALLLGARVATQADGAKSLRASRIALLKELDDGAWVGDVSALRALLAEIEGGIESIAAEEEKAHQALAEERLAAREEIVVEAEQLAAGDEESTHWKNAQARMAELFEAWKAEQRTTPRLSKAQEDPLWKRFREARSTFERRRKAFFVKRDKDAAEIKKAKDEIIAEAEKLSASRDFGPTTKAYHRLMDQWKALGRGPRKTEDAQWKRFRAAQDVFFSARDQANAQTDAEFAENLRVKEDILSKLRELMPFTKPAAVRERYFKLIDEWDAAGKVPRQDVKRMERSLAEVQDAFREASSTTKAESASPKDERQEAMLAQLEDTIAGLERDLAHARESNDSKAISEAEEALAARRSWLQMLKSA